MSGEVLVSIPQNPMPPGGVAGYVTTRDGVRLRFARWRTTAGRLKGTVVLAPGRSEYIEKYYETVGDLRARGFGVLVFDWRGQGGSSRALANPRKGHLTRIDEFETDLRAVIEQVALPDCTPPYFGLAHSMGALAMLYAAPRLGTWLERIVLSAPFIGLSSAYGPPDLARVAARIARTLGLGRAYAPGGTDTPGDWSPFAGNPVTSDPLRYARSSATIEARPALGLGGPTFGWLDAMFRAQAEVVTPEFGQRVAIPVLIVAAGMDTIVSTPASVALGRTLRVGRTIVVDGAKHELLMERDIYRDPFMAAFDAFVPGTPTF